MTFKSPWHSLQADRRRHDALYGGRSYASKVLGYGPIAYWPLWEASGTVAECLTDSAMNGVYSSDVAGWPPGAGIGDGHTAPRFDGANDYVDVQTAALQVAFPGDEGTLLAWLQVSGAGVWTDGATRTVFRTADTTDFQESVFLYKSNTNNWFSYVYQAGAVTETVVRTNCSTTAWVPIAVTWSSGADEVKAYWAGAQTGTTQTTLGTWAGTIDLTVIGANNSTPLNPWSGGIAHVQVYDRALALGSIANLSVV